MLLLRAKKSGIPIWFPDYFIIVFVNVIVYFTIIFLPSLMMRPFALLFRRWPATL